MSEIKLKIVDQVIVAENSPEIFSGDKNIDKVSFSFCSEWDGYEKIAVFYNDPANPYHIFLDENNSATIPHEVMADETNLYIGAIGIKDKFVRTSGIIEYRIQKGALTGVTYFDDPTPSIFEQLLEKLSAIDEKLSLIQVLTVEEVDEICDGTYAEVLDDTNLSPIMELSEIPVDEVKEICT